MTHSLVLGAVALLLINTSKPDANPADWRKTPPKEGPSPELILPTFEKTKLDNDLTIMVSEQNELPIVAFRLVTRGGSVMDPKEGDGLGHLVYQMLDEGAGDKDALAFSDALADLGASLGSSCGRYSGSVYISGLKRHQDRLVGLLADAVLRPQLKEQDFSRIKARTLASLDAQLGSPQGLAFLALPGILFGKEHPLGHPSTGTPEYIKKHAISNIRSHHKKLLSPERSALIAVGNISLSEAKALAEKHFRSWKASSEANLAIPPVEAVPRKEIVFVDKPASPQTIVVFARPVFGQGHPDKDALVVANGAWGGSFSSRLNMNLREDKGYTYGANSGVSFGKDLSIFFAYSALQSQHSVAGLKEFFTEFEQLKTIPFTDSEIDRIKQGIIRGLPGDFERIGDLASEAANLFVNEIPLDALAKKAKQISSLTKKQIQNTAETYLKAPLMKVLLVGDAKTVLPALENAQLGPVRVEKL